MNLVQTRIGDAGLAELAKLPALKALEIDGTLVTDAGIAHLKAVGGLEAISLRGTRVTQAGAKALQEMHPKLQLTR